MSTFCNTLNVRLNECDYAFYVGGACCAQSIRGVRASWEMAKVRCATFLSYETNPRCIIPRPGTLARGEGWKEVNANAKDNFIELIDAEATYLRKSGWVLVRAYGMDYYWNLPSDNDPECEWDHDKAVARQKQMDVDTFFSEN